MKKIKLILFLSVILIISLIMVFSHVPHSDEDALNYGDPIIMNSSQLMQETGFNAYENFRHSSDPTARGWCHASPNGELWLYTTCDLDDLDSTSDVEKYPMSNIYCYSTTDMENWLDWGSVLHKSDFTWADQNHDHLWAPEITLWDIDGDITWIIYAPLLIDETTDARDDCPDDWVPVSKVGVARSVEGPDGGHHGLFTAEPDYIQGLVLNSVNNGYVSDPAFFSEKVGDVSNLYLTYTNGDWWTDIVGQIALAKMSNVTTVEEDYGEVEITGYNADNYYQEGSAIFKINDKYYLIWSQIRQPNPTGNQEIAYAMKDDLYAGGDASKQWEYKGVIMQEQSNWTNHAYIAKFWDSTEEEFVYYFMYHRGDRNMDPDAGPLGNNRNVHIQPLEFNADGTIQEVIHTQVKGWSKYNMKLSYILDEGYHESNIVKPRIYLENDLCGTLKNFKVKYYFSVENGKTPVIEDWWTPHCTLSLEHFSGNIWAVVMHFDITLEPGDRIPEEGGIIFGIHYSDWSYFDKSNDFSQPPSNSYTLTHNIAIFDNADNLITGNIPDTESTGPNTIVIRARGTQGGEHINLLINGNPVNSGWWLSTSFQEFTATVDGDGDINIQFDNDAPNMDVIIDWVKVNAQNPRQAENMEYNTGAWDGYCGGGSYTEWLHCNGVIGFGNISDNFD